MTCPRSWQVEAARDGRLTGKDLVGALRHRERCVDCAREDLELARLGGAFEDLPLLERDPLTMHRERQQLMASMNDELLAPPRAKAGFRVAVALFSVLAIASGLFVALRKAATSVEASNLPRSVVEVSARPGASWIEHVDASTDRIDLADGSASFCVHPHQPRRVLIDLPDGEVEDVGTVFEIDVSKHRTCRISVREGRVSVRLSGRPEFILSAGETWREPESVANGLPETVSGSANNSSPSPLVPVPPRVRKARPAASAPLVAKPASSAGSNAVDSRPARNEDLAYLSIVTLLNQQKYAAAQSAAKDYLLRFPNGFRRIEVLNVVMHSAGSGLLNGDPGSTPTGTRTVTPLSK